MLPISFCHAWAGEMKEAGGGHLAVSLHSLQPNPSRSLLLPWLTVMLLCAGAGEQRPFQGENGEVEEEQKVENPQRPNSPWSLLLSHL